MNINYQRSKLGDRSKTQHFNAETVQLIIAKISSNALNQGSKKHSVLRQRNSQLQNTKLPI